MNFIIFGFIVLILLINLFLKGKKIDSKYINLFKFFFPSWSFFDGSSDTPCLLYKINDSEEWKFTFSPKKTKLHQLFFNPDGNLYMAYHSHIQQLATEIFERQNDPCFSLTNSINYKIAINFVRFRARKKFKKIQTFQVKLAYVKKSHSGQVENVDDIFISPIYEY